MSVEDILKDPDLLAFAQAGGAAAFKVNCVQCHGSGAAGGAGYPNLNDDDWLWGGTPDADLHHAAERHPLHGRMPRRATRRCRPSAPTAS